MTEARYSELKWREYSLDDIFTIRSTKSSIDKNKLNGKSGRFPYVTRTEFNNGYDEMVDGQVDYQLDDGNVITIGLDTQTAFYQPHPFYTGQNIQVLSCTSLDRHNALFLVTRLRDLMKKFNWGGNGATLTRLRHSRVLLPSDQNGDPDWHFMSDFIKEKEKRLIERHKKLLLDGVAEGASARPLPAVNDIKWREFFIEDIAEILSGRDIYAKERRKGDTPYVTSTSLNNGIGYYVSNTNSTKEAGCLSVNRNGSVGYSFYHPYEALFSNDCRKLRLKVSNKEVGIFISQQITRQRGKYGYGYKMGTGRLKRQKIMLPVDDDGEPDYAYMQSYIRQKLYNQITKYSSYLATREVRA